MKEISLTKLMVSLVDDDDYEELIKVNWYAQKGKNTYYAAHRLHSGPNKLESMHRVIMKAAPEQVVDHRDRNGLNNQRDNLRFCTHSQNGANKKARGASKYLGVGFWQAKRDGKVYKAYWVAAIKVNRKTRVLGYFKTEEEAAIAYNKAATEVHGEFANLNDINVAVNTEWADGATERIWERISDVIKWPALLLMGVFISLQVSAQDEWPVHWKYKIEKVNSDTYILHLTPSINDGWHIYSQKQPKSSVSQPTVFTYETNAILKYPGPTNEKGDVINWSDSITGIQAREYTKVSFNKMVVVRYKNVKTAIAGTVTYQACTDEMCLLPKTESFSLSIN